MAVREFNGAGDRVLLAVGGLSAATHGTYGAIFKVDNTAAVRCLFVFLTSGGSFAWAPFVIETDDTAVWSSGGSGAATSAAIPQATWLTMIVRKATGTATPRFSYYNHTSTTWTHGNAIASVANGTAPTGGSIAPSSDSAGSESFDGRIALLAGWSNAVHWTADASGDTAIEAAGLEDSLQNWVDESPNMLCPYNQDPLSAVDDIIGGADQTSVTGTTVVTGDDPPGFSFALGTPASRNLFLTRSNLDLV
jgi:hypothetical protein